MSDQMNELRERAWRGERGALGDLLELALAQEDHELRMEAKRALARLDERVWINARDESVLIEIPAGRGVLGRLKTSGDAPTYYMAQHPVTNRQFAEFLAQTGYEPQDQGMGEFLAHWPAGQPPQERLDHPVVYVSMIDAMHYCQWAGLILPSEWMWERAAAGAGGGSHPWGAVATHEELATINAPQTQHVEAHRKVRTAYGCQDMIGNVSEWCVPGDDVEVDFISPSPAMFTRESSAVAGTQMCVRGSAYLRTNPHLMTCQHRRRLAAGRRNQWVGFRVAALVKGSTSHADKWGELRSSCHETGIEERARLAKIDYVLATWPRDHDASHEVRAYLRGLVKWSAGQVARPDLYIMEMWLNGRRGHVFEALCEAGEQRPPYGLLDRCVEQLRGQQGSRDALIIGQVEPVAQAAIIEWLSERARTRRGEQVNDASSPSSLIFIDVSLPQVGRVIPAIELEQQSGQLSISTSWSGSAAPWEEWSAAELMQWLEALVQIVIHHPTVTITLDIDEDRVVRQELRELWRLYARHRGLASE